MHKPAQAITALTPPTPTPHPPRAPSRHASSGDTQFCANVTDGFVVTTSCVNIQVAAPDPLAVDDPYSCAFNLVCSVPAAQGVLANDVSSSSLSFTVVGAPTASAGTVVVNADGSFDWTPPSS